jgi:hypothetical protein
MHSKVGQASRLPSADASRGVVEERLAQSLFSDPTRKGRPRPRALAGAGQAGRLPYFLLHDYGLSGVRPSSGAETREGPKGLQRCDALEQGILLRPRTGALRRKAAPSLLRKRERAVAHHALARTRRITGVP